LTKSIQSRGEEIRAFILDNIQDAGAEGLATRITEQFGISRQAANRHLKNLSDEGALIAEGKTRSRSYKIAETASCSWFYPIVDGLEEDVVWRKDIRPALGTLPDSVVEIWHWAFTEMFNNAIDHSGGTLINVNLSKTAIDSELSIRDDGVGIFRKIQDALGLLDERQAIFELSKGKLTTDAKNHSGQGIFFTSRMVDSFDILSGGVYFAHEIGSENDWMLERDESKPGTSVYLKVNNHTARTIKKVMSKFSAKGSYGFNKTIVPVKLARYGTDQLISRSQAKRVLARVELFSQVIFDFTGVETIGQAFADQIFRVFATEHPEVQLLPSHTNRDIMGTIQAAIKSGRPGFKGENTAGDAR
jgi:anti-sigma regulatory factor (Ser/Thr protein kinase)/biotin operon repressor